MLGRFLGIAAVIAAVSVGVAGMASRSTSINSVETAVDDEKTDGDGSWPGNPVGALTSSSLPPTGEVRLGRASDSHFYADANVDGTNIRMMVDSGASIVALTRADADAMGIDVDRLPIAGTARTAGGDVPMRRLILDSVDIDGVEVRRVEAAIVDSNMAVSLLGQSFLSKLDAVNIEGDTMTLR